MLNVLGPWASCLFANSLIEGQWWRNGSPPQAIKGILNTRNRVGILAGDGINSSIVYAKTIRTIGYLGEADREAQGESEGSITSAVNISAIKSSSAVPEAKGGRRGGCRMGAESPVSISCCSRSQKPMSVGDLAKTCW